MLSVPKRDSTFTAKFVATAKPGEYRDAISPLRLAVQQSGHRSFIVRYRRPGDGRTAKLTFAPDLSLAGARHAATAALLQLENGIDPSPPRTPRSDRRAADKIEAAVADFLDLHVRRKNRPSTVAATERMFKQLVLPVWHGRTVHDVRRRDVIDLVEDIAASGRGYLANRTRGVLSKFFNWLKSRDRIEVSPVDGVERPHEEQVRDRILSDSELAALWAACEGDELFGSALRLLVLTGCRRNEVSAMRWSELDDKRREWLLPGQRSKNGRPHLIPLSPQAWSIIETRPRINGSEYLFTRNGHKPIIGWPVAKRRLSAKAGIDEASWRLHDLRRTTASGMQKLGVRVEVVEKALNHVSGSFRGIVSVYQTHGYADEIRIAFQKWSDHVGHLTGGKPGKVIALRQP